MIEWYIYITIGTDLRFTVTQRRHVGSGDVKGGSYFAGLLVQHLCYPSWLDTEDSKLKPLSWEG